MAFKSAQTDTLKKISYWDSKRSSYFPFPIFISNLIVKQKQAKIIFLFPSYNNKSKTKINQKKMCRCSLLFFFFPSSKNYLLNRKSPTHRIYFFFLTADLYLNCLVLPKLSLDLPPKMMIIWFTYNIYLEFQHKFPFRYIYWCCCWSCWYTIS